MPLVLGPWDHKLGSLKQQTFFSPTSGDLKSEIKGLAGLVPSGGGGGRISFRPLSQLLATLATLGVPGLGAS